MMNDLTRRGMSGQLRYILTLCYVDLNVARGYLNVTKVDHKVAKGDFKVIKVVLQMTHNGSPKISSADNTQNLKLLDCLLDVSERNEMGYLLLLVDLMAECHSARGYV